MIELTELPPAYHEHAVAPGAPPAYTEPHATPTDDAVNHAPWSGSVWIKLFTCPCQIAAMVMYIPVYALQNRDGVLYNDYCHFDAATRRCRTDFEIC
jgi:hypothetical protein